MLRPVVPCAYLRVFQPLEAFSREEQSRWERYLLEGAPRPLRPVYRQRITGDRIGLLTRAGDEGADVRLVDGTYYISPWRTRLRVLASLLAFGEAVPFEGAEAFTPEDEIRRASRELSRLRRKDPDQISFVHQSPWHVPVRWFTLFEDQERRLLERRGRFRLSYLTTVRRARRRAERAIPALQRSDLRSVGELIGELHAWLTNFDGRSLLELDYGRLCDLLTWDEMDDDHSAREIQEAMGALATEEFPRSADLYQAVLTRSAELRNHESLN
jgi:hypothetical protein